MLDQETVAILEPEEQDAPHAACANCGLDALRHTMRTPLGYGCPVSGCLEFVAVD